MVTDNNGEDNNNANSTNQSTRRSLLKAMGAASGGFTVGGLAGTAAADDSNAQLDQASQQPTTYTVGPDEARIKVNAQRARSVATFQLSNDATIKFIGIRNNEGCDEVAVIELWPPCSTPVVSTIFQPSLVEKYRAVAPEGTPIPRMVVAADELVDQSDVNNTTEDIVGTISVDEIGASALPDSDCDPLETGCMSASEFSSFACQGTGPSNMIKHCDLGPHTWVRRSGRRRKNSLGITNSCGYSTVRHYYQWLSGPWDEVLECDIPGGYTMISEYNGIVRRNRRIYHRTWPASTYWLRAASYFWT